MIHRRRRKRPACVIELHVHGLLYVRVERIPRWLAVLATAVSVISTWWLALSRR